MSTILREKKQQLKLRARRQNDVEMSVAAPAAPEPAEAMEYYQIGAEPQIEAGTDPTVTTVETVAETAAAPEVQEVVQPTPRPVVPSVPDPAAADRQRAEKVGDVVERICWAIAALIPVVMVAVVLMGAIHLSAAAVGIVFYIVAARLVVTAIRESIVLVARSRPLLRVLAVIGLGALLATSSGAAWQLCVGGAVFYLFADHMLGKCVPA